MAGAVNDRRIELLPEIVASLPTGGRKAFESMYEVRRDRGSLTIPEPMMRTIRRQFGDPGAVSNQTIVGVTNRYTLEATAFNSLRALRPMAQDDSAGPRAPGRDRGDPFADPQAQTPENSIGRVRGRRCVTAPNVAASDAWHGVIVFDEPDPLAFDSGDVLDYLSTGLEWARRAHEHDERATHPFLFWNANARAGASLTHGHAQVIVRRDAPLARIEIQRSAAARYRAEYPGGNYFEDLMDVHTSLGLSSRVEGSEVAAHLTPIKEREVIMTGAGLNEGFFRSIGRVLVAFRDALGVESFNLAVFGPPFGNAEEIEGWEGFPAVARIVDRGPSDLLSSDIGGMELYGQSVVSADPFEVARIMSEML